MQISGRCEECQAEFWFERDDAEDPVDSLGYFARCLGCKKVIPIAMEHPDFKFKDISFLPRTYASTLPAAEALQKPWRAFVQNMDRVRSLGRSPELVVFQWNFSQGDVRWNDIEKLEAEEAAAGIARKPKDNPSYRILHNNLFDADNVFETIPGMAMHLAIEGLFSSMILGTWTAFETLSGDLWEGALNTRPDEIAKLAGARSAGAKDGDSQKSIDLNRLAEHGFNVSNVMGTLLRGRFNFQVLDDIRYAYNCAFGKRCANAMKAVHSDAIQHLSATRNILVHKAGIIDDKFKQDTKSSPHFATLTTGAQLKLDGRVVADLVLNAVTQVIEIITSIDKYLGAKPA
jgi:hypothetical protein